VSRLFWFVWYYFEDLIGFTKYGRDGANTGTVSGVDWEPYEVREPPLILAEIAQLTALGVDCSAQQLLGHGAICNALEAQQKRLAFLIKFVDSGFGDTAGGDKFYSFYCFYQVKSSD
jgi:hypothetical protein